MKNGSGRGAEDMPLMLEPDMEQSVGNGMTPGTYVYGYVNDRGVIVYERVICH
ncbi:FasE domain protein [Escherichia coli]|nr:FasE domain protein [Escherichia coli]